MFSRRTMPAILSNPFLPPHFFTIALVLSVNSLLFSSCYSIDEQGRALLTWKDNNLTSPTDALSSWNPGAETPCSWFGVLCNSKGEVVEISLTAVDLQGTLPTNFQALKFLKTLSISSTNITGTIPKEFGDYVELSILNLSNNNLLGNIPEEICRLSKLEELSLNSNALEGIPLEIGNLSNLVNLALFDNIINGEIPRSIGMLKKLETLKVGGNENLNGGLPMEIGNCSSLTMIGLPETGITGPLPSSIGMLKRIQSIAVYSTPLSGPIPEEIVNCTDLQNVFLYGNNLSGAIPRGIGRLINLQKLILWLNNLEGDIPEEIGNCKELVVLDISENRVTGSIPKSLGSLPKLRDIQLSTNQLTGTIPPEITNCSSLVHMEIDNNRIWGEMPVDMGNLKNLNIFYTWQNRLTGSIPSSLSSCHNLQALDFSYNHLSGPIPKELFGLKNLTKVLMISNNLSGIIPPDIGNCTKLFRLRLKVNRIGGTIPSEIGNLKNLNFFDIGENLVVGGLPPSLLKCDNLQFIDLHSNGLNGPFLDGLPKNLQYLDISNNRLHGQISPAIGGLVEITKLDLRNNQLSGEIPGEIVSCGKLQYLDLSNNGFSGELPKVLGQISSLEIGLNLSCNQFSGEIPSEFSYLTKLGILDLSYNNLSGNLSFLVDLENLVSLNISHNEFSGELPDTQFFRNLPLIDITGNKGLSVSDELLTPKDSVVSHSRSREVIKIGVPILITISAVLFFLAIYMLLRTHMANSSILTEGEKWEITLFQKLNFSIDVILQNLTPSNVIGTGGSGVVYRVTTPNGGTMAVKKMWSNEESGAFSSEIQTLGSIRHKNIIRLLGSGSNRHLKLLFYDYLPNGSLSSLIHGAGKGGAEWETRYEILLGLAHALAYLHHDCVPPILHGDVKSMNVLLGHNFEPCLADFGLARNVSKNSDDYATGKPFLGPHLVGSFGYMAPEQGSMVRITEKSDVYSFGVVIMEVLTGRHPLDPTLPDGANLVQWVQDHFATTRNPAAILDSKLRGRTDSTMHEMLQTLTLGLICVGVRTEDRPPMKDVVAMLEEIPYFKPGRAAAADGPKTGMTVVVQSPWKNQGSTQSSFVFSDD